MTHLDYDILIAGGGPAGFAAAVSAARLGAKTLLLEGSTALGGMATMGLVTAYDPMADGVRNLAGGIMKEIMDGLWQRGWLPSHVTPQKWESGYLSPSNINPELVKIFLDEMAAEAGVEVRFLSRVVGVQADPDAGRVAHLTISQIDGLQEVRADMFIDCTGDAALAAQAGVAHRLATRDTPAPMPASLCFIIGNIDEDRKEHWKKYADQALADGHFSQPEVRLVPMRLGHGVYAFNAGHIFEKNFTNPKDYNESLALGRKMALEHFEFLRKYVPGYEQSILVSTAPLLGVRESRRIIGEYELTWGDFADGRHYPDQIGVYAKEVDIHAHSLDPAIQERSRRFREAKAGWLPKGASYGIPYGVIVPRGWKNLWVAGRAGSFDEVVYGSVRVMPACSMMGEAAGAAAVQALRTGQTADQLDTATLVQQLRRQNAYLPQDTLTSEMTRGRGADQPSNPLCPVMDLEHVRPHTSVSAAPSGDKKTTPERNVKNNPVAPAETAGEIGTSELADVLKRFAHEIDQSCCRTLFHDADEYCAKLLKAAENAGSPEQCAGLLRDLAEHLETSCCQSTLTLSPDDVRACCRRHAAPKEIFDR